MAIIVTCKGTAYSDMKMVKSDLSASGYFLSRDGVLYEPILELKKVIDIGSDGHTIADDETLEGTGFSTGECIVEEVK